jgi:hypothetical protein
MRVADVVLCAIILVLQAEAAKAAELKGPHSFSFARLMAVYANLLAADENHTAAAGSSLAAQQLQQMHGDAAAAGCGGAAAAMGGGWLGVQSADVMLGVKNLVSSRLLTQVGHGSAKWQEAWSRLGWPQRLRTPSLNPRGC